MSKCFRAWITGSVRGDFIANVVLPVHPSDRCRGWHQTRHATPELAAAWVAGVIQNHMTKRVKFYADRRNALFAALAAVKGGEVGG